MGSFFLAVDGRSYGESRWQMAGRFAGPDLLRSRPAYRG